MRRLDSTGEAKRLEIKDWQEMSLQTAKFVISALQHSDYVMTATDGRIFFVARDNAAEEEDKIPYVVVMPEGVSEYGSKDWGGEMDNDKVSVMVVAGDGEGLMTLAESVRRALPKELSTYEAESFKVEQLSFSAGAVMMDSSKPCYYQTLSYEIDTTNKDIEDGTAEE